MKLQRRIENDQRTIAALALIGQPREVCECGRTHGKPHNPRSAAAATGANQQAVYRAWRKQNAV